MFELTPQPVHLTFKRREGAASSVPVYAAQHKAGELGLVR